MLCHDSLKKYKLKIPPLKSLDNIFLQFETINLRCDTRDYYDIMASWNRAFFVLYINFLAYKDEKELNEFLQIVSRTADSDQGICGLFSMVFFIIIEREKLLLYQVQFWFCVMSGFSLGSDPGQDFP